MAYNQFANPFDNPFGLPPDAMQRMSGGIPTYGVSPQKVEIPQMGQTEPMQELQQPLAKEITKDVPAEQSKSVGQMGAAGVLAASTLLGKLMEGKALRDKAMRERKAEAAKTSAKATMDTLSMQQKGTADPLTQLVAAYR